MIKSTRILYEYGDPSKSKTVRNVAVGATGALAVGTEAGRAALGGIGRGVAYGVGRGGKYAADHIDSAHYNKDRVQDYFVNHPGQNQSTSGDKFQTPAPKSDRPIPVLNIPGAKSTPLSQAPVNNTTAPATQTAPTPTSTPVTQTSASPPQYDIEAHRQRALVKMAGELHGKYTDAKINGLNDNNIDQLKKEGYLTQDNSSTRLEQRNGELYQQRYNAPTWQITTPSAPSPSPSSAPVSSDGKSLVRGKQMPKEEQQRRELTPQGNTTPPSSVPTTPSAPAPVVQPKPEIIPNVTGSNSPLPTNTIPAQNPTAILPNVQQPPVEVNSTMTPYASKSAAKAAKVVIPGQDSTMAGSVADALKKNNPLI